MSILPTHHQYSFVVDASSIDENGHVNNVEYVRWMQEAATAHATALGLLELMAREGTTWVAREHTIKYLQPAFAGETIGVQTWVVNFRKVRSTRRYRFIRLPEQTLLAEGATDWINVDATTGKPRPVPKPVQEMFADIKSDTIPVSTW